MWLIGQDGFSSTVRFVPAKDRAMAERFGATDPQGDYLLVRGRDRQQLQLIATRFELTLEADTDADYKYRLVLTRDQFKTHAVEQIDAINYTAHFKEASMARPVNKGFAAWQTALYAIWHELELTQDTPAYQTKVWPRKGWDWPEVKTAVRPAIESASVFASALGWDELLEQPEVQRLTLPGSADGYSFTDRLIDDDDLDDPWLWDPEFSDMTDDELAELGEFENWQRLNEQIVRENATVVGCASDTVAGTVSVSPRKQRRRNRRERKANQKGK